MPEAKSTPAAPPWTFFFFLDGLQNHLWPLLPSPVLSSHTSVPLLCPSLAPCPPLSASPLLLPLPVPRPVATGVIFGGAGYPQSSPLPQVPDAPFIHSLHPAAGLAPGSAEKQQPPSAFWGKNTSFRGWVPGGCWRGRGLPEAFPSRCPTPPGMLTGRGTGALLTSTPVSPRGLHPKLSGHHRGCAGDRGNPTAPSSEPAIGRKTEKPKRATASRHLSASLSSPKQVHLGFFSTFSYSFF